MKQNRSDDKEFPIAAVSRNDVREVMGNSVANRLSDEDLERLAAEMADLYLGNSFAEDMKEIIEYKFSD